MAREIESINAAALAQHPGQIAVWPVCPGGWRGEQQFVITVEAGEPANWAIPARVIWLAEGEAMVAWETGASYRGRWQRQVRISNAGGHALRDVVSDEELV